MSSEQGASWEFFVRPLRVLWAGINHDVGSGWHVMCLNNAKNVEGYQKVRIVLDGVFEVVSRTLECHLVAKEMTRDTKMLNV